MEIIESFTANKWKDPVSLCVGVFDGVHLGHQKMLHELKKQGTKSVVVTFKNHPKAWLQSSAPQLIHPFNQRLDYFEVEGVDIVVALDFNEDIQPLTAKQFLDQCQNMFHIETFIKGYDTKIGSDRISSIETLLQNSKVIDILPFKQHDTLISSQKIREEIKKKNFQQVAFWLGRVYKVKLDLRERLDEQSGRIFIDDLCISSLNLDQPPLSTYPFLEIEFS